MGSCQRAEKVEVVSASMCGKKSRDEQPGRITGLKKGKNIAVSVTAWLCLLASLEGLFHPYNGLVQYIVDWERPLIKSTYSVLLQALSSFQPSCSFVVTSW